MPFRETLSWVGPVEGLLIATFFVWAVAGVWGYINVTRRRK